jgi:hypothetical protein
MTHTAVELPKGLRGVLWVLLYAGAITFLLEVRSTNALRAWQIFLVNVLFWSSMAQGALIFAATYDLTRARWGIVFKHFAQGMGLFLPISLLLFLVLFAGSETLLPWVREPLPEKASWLNVPFLFSRDILGLIILYGFGLAYLFYALRPVIGASLHQQGVPHSTLLPLLTRGWRGLKVEQERSQRVLAFLIPLFLILYVVVFSLIGFDWVMSLDPHWHSTLFGAYFFISSFYLGLAATAILAVLLRKSLHLETVVGRKQLHDLGKLLFGFCLVAGDFFWSQYVVIWYGNIPEETEYIILRTKEMPWAVLAWIVLILCFGGPFLVLLSRWVKEHPTTLLSVAAGIVVGMWLERYLLVVPSLWHVSGFPLGWIELLITLGFVAAFLLTYLTFISHFPILQSASEVPDSMPKAAANSSP